MSNPRIAAGLLCALSGLAAVGVAQQGDPHADLFWRTTKNCGANCLYLLLYARGYELAYEDVLAATPIRQAGSTLADLQQAADALNVPVRLGKGTPGDLQRATLPLMIHMDTASGEADATGHYLLVTEIHDDSGVVEVFDGSSALRTRVSMNELQRNWSGFVLEVPGPAVWKYQLWISIATLLAASYVFRRRSRVLATASVGVVRRS